MKRLSYVLLTILIVTTSCRNIKDLKYLQDVANEEIISGNVKKIPEYKIRPMDNLYVSIKTLDPEVNQLFNSTTSSGGFMTGTQQMYGDLVSQYINGYQVDSAGAITLPILGDIDVSGLTLEQARSTIQDASFEYLTEPVVSIKLLSFRINISGEVTTPGIYYNYQKTVNILDAISMANGITDNANIKDVYVIRKENNSTITYNLDLTKKDFYNSPGFFLHPYDMVYVNPGINKKIDLNTQTYQLFLTTITTIVGLNFLYQPFQL